MPVYTIIRRIGISEFSVLYNFTRICLIIRAHRTRAGYRIRCVYILLYLRTHLQGNAVVAGWYYNMHVRHSGHVLIYRWGGLYGLYGTEWYFFRHHFRFRIVYLNGRIEHSIMYIKCCTFICLCLRKYNVWQVQLHRFVWGKWGGGSP